MLELVGKSVGCGFRVRGKNMTGRSERTKHFLFLQEKEKKWRKILAKVPSSKNVLDEGEKFFILNFCELGGGFKLKRKSIQNTCSFKMKGAFHGLP